MFLKFFGLKPSPLQSILINRLPISGLKKSPWELLFNRQPDYSKLKVFGCQCYPWLKPYIHSKLDAKSKSCVFLGYSLQHKGYRCLDPITNRIYISRHVVFDEKLIPLSHCSSTVPLQKIHFCIFSIRGSSLQQTFLQALLQLVLLQNSQCSSVPPPITQTSTSTASSSGNQSVDYSQILPVLSLSVNPLSLPIQPSHPPIYGNTHPMITRSKAGIYSLEPMQQQNIHFQLILILFPVLICKHQSMLTGELQCKLNTMP